MSFLCFFIIIVHNIIDIIIFIGLQNRYTLDILISIVEDAIIIKFHKVWKIAKGNILFNIIANGTKENPNKLETITLTYKFQIKNSVAYKILKSHYF